MSLSNATNRLKITLNIMLAQVALMVIPLEFSESVPNAEQVSVVDQLFGLLPQLTAARGTNTNDGSLFNAAAHAEVDTQIIAADGTVLLDLTGIKFDPSVPNEEQALVLKALAEFGVKIEAALTVA